MNDYIFELLFWMVLIEMVEKWDHNYLLVSLYIRYSSYMIKQLIYSMYQFSHIFLLLLLQTVLTDGGGMKYCVHLLINRRGSYKFHSKGEYILAY